MANFITMLRVAVTPGFVVLMVLSNSHPNLKYVAFGLFFFGALTDWADGFVARRTDSVTDFGKTADPLADRLFIGATLIRIASLLTEGGNLNDFKRRIFRVCLNTHCPKLVFINTILKEFLDFFW